jgi:hypothetical protein
MIEDDLTNAGMGGMSEWVRTPNGKDRDYCFSKRLVPLGTLACTYRVGLYQEVNKSTTRVPAMGDS